MTQNRLEVHKDVTGKGPTGQTSLVFDSTRPDAVEGEPRKGHDSQDGPCFGPKAFATNLALGDTNGQGLDQKEEQGYGSRVGA